ncbi:MAG TPA: hypothetical protein VI197_02170 [Polyangiaceae bacterium]
MRWFIEVSTVGSGDTDTEYCVEAKQWQAALQQARKLRGEAGPLSAFSIELLDSGYRAVDKKQNLKYVVKKAPNDAPLNDGKNGVGSVVAEAAATAAANFEGEAGNAESSDPGAAREPSAPGHQVAVSPRGSGPPPKPRLVSSRPPADEAAPTAADKPGKSQSSHPSAAKKSPQKVAELLAAAAMKASNRSSAASPGQSARVGSGAANAGRPAPVAGLANTAILAQGPEVASSMQQPGLSSSPVLAVEARLHKETAQRTEPANEATDLASPPSPQADTSDDLPDFEVIRSRGEEPSKETPITYREVALGVHPGVSKSATRRLMLARYRSIANEIAERPKGKFVQVAVFDHVFGQKPLRPPLATLVWKDWRGEPVLAFQGFSGDSVQPPPPLGEPAMGSLRPISVIPVGETTGSRPPPPQEVASSSTQKGAPADGDNTSSAQTQDTAGAPAGADAISEQAAARPAATAAGTASAIPAAAGVGGDRSGAGVAMDEVVPLQNKKARDSRPGLKRSGDPSSDDLILDLFERMHELHFMADVVNGSEFVLRVVKQTLPSAFVLIHVFDINTKNFVVVRQSGGNREDLLMFQTPDSDALVRKVMRASRTVKVTEAEAAGAFGDGRWKAARAPVGPLLVGPVKQGGRYLGMIEIANPSGAKAFADTEANALDYICEQFAEFLTNRPIVLDADVILK